MFVVSLVEDARVYFIADGEHEIAEKHIESQKPTDCINCLCWGKL